MVGVLLSDCSLVFELRDSVEDHDIVLEAHELGDPPLNPPLHQVYLHLSTRLSIRARVLTLFRFTGEANSGGA
jgi:hypothetical protein